MDDELRSMFEKQGYAVVGNHSAVKTCHWLRESLMRDRVCYKQEFFGISSHRCLQMTPVANACNHRCLYCWRYQGKEDVSDVWDDPEKIVEGTIAAQRRLVAGFKGDERCDPAMWEEARAPNQVAISLTGEPTFYPYLGALIAAYRRRDFTTFLVTNGTMPHVLRDLDPLPTQLYVSLDAPNREIYRKLCLPQHEGLWDRIMETVQIMPSLDTRRVARHTLVEGWNVGYEEEYAEMDLKGDFDFIEPKGYVHVGYSRERLERSNMPSFERIRGFAERMSELTGYLKAGENPASKVILLSNGAKDMSIF
ncbi:MAG: 4-demethylwyosine synthase TYW1 [Candidatus Thermoplasmatota archaeon]|nr:4-demethylwyosine synthase TYW1 [Candidatus Thermoplasmatota archaeon]